MGDCRCVLALALSLLATSAVAAQPEPRSFMRIEIGAAEIHASPKTGAMLAFLLGRRVDANGVLRLELGSSYYGSDAAHFALESGAELRPLAQYRVTPVIGLGAGFIVESNVRSEMFRGTAALDVKATARTAFRVGAQFAYHVSEDGPHAFFVGIEKRVR